MIADCGVVRKVAIGMRRCSGISEKISAEKIFKKREISLVCGNNFFFFCVLDVVSSRLLALVTSVKRLGRR